MKKLALALVCLFSVAFFASCDPDEPIIEHPEPLIAIINSPGYITGTIDAPQLIEFDIDDTDYHYGFHVESNPETKKALATLEVNYVQVFEGETYTYDSIIDLSGLTSYDFDEAIYADDAKEIFYECTITATVKDVDGLTNTANISFKMNAEIYLEPTAFTWVRVGGTPGEGLAELGLKWEKNQKDVYAVIEPVEGATLYSVPAEKWNEITTEAELAALFSDGGAAPIKDYRGVSCTVPATYDDVIATYYEGFYYLIHITKGTIDQRTYVFTIEGEWK